MKNTPSSIVIAIDGPAASGKGTLARRLADHFDFAHLDTGALYRAVAHIVLTAGHKVDSEEHAVDAALLLKDTLKPGDLDIAALRQDDVGAASSKVAAFESVRSILLDLQKSFAGNPPDHKKGAVLDGRDIGTVICPDARVKLFITAETETRAKRRYKELQSKGIEATYAAVLTDMRERDKRDSERSIAPLKPAEDALILDTSDLSADEAYFQALAHIDEKFAIIE